MAILVRNARYVVPDPVSGCWNWTRSLNDQGYGQFTYAGKTYRAHRALYAYYTGEDVRGKVLCHRCDNRACCNPGHIIAGTQADNLRDMVSKGRHWTVNNPDKRPRGDAHWTKRTPISEPYGFSEEAADGGAGAAGRGAHGGGGVYSSHTGGRVLSEHVHH